MTRLWEGGRAMKRYVLALAFACAIAFAPPGFAAAPIPAENAR